MDGYVLKTGDLFLFTDGDDRLAGGQAGLFRQDTRYLSRLEWLVDGERPATLHTWTDGCTSRALMGHPLERKAAVSPYAVEIQRRRVVGEAFYEEVRLVNHHREPLQLKLRLVADADFADMFLVRGYPLQDERPPVARETSPGGFRLDYQGRDGVARFTRVRVEPEGRVEDGDLLFELSLEPQASFIVRVRVEVGEGTMPGPEEAPAGSAGTPRSHGQRAAAGPLRPLDHLMADEVQRREDAEQAWLEATTSVEAPDEDLVLLWERGRRDLLSLATDMGDGPVPTAGVPWFAVLFGRDSLLAAREALLLTPALARATLFTLARYQGRGHDAWREEAPGKILHELRRGELARMGTVPHTPYYGSVDATPLFLILAADLTRWMGDTEAAARLRPHVEAALAWITGEGDLDGDGFLEYDGQGLLPNQGWKDSFDSTVTPEGTLAPPPIALVEVQGYLVAALKGAASLARFWGEPRRGGELEARARGLQRSIARHFSLGEGRYALALDGEKRPVATLASNPGHLLWCGALEQAEGDALARRLMESDLFSGYGIRTLAAGQRAYDPLSYHNGSVWPHDTALIARGMARFGRGEEAARLVRGILDASRALPWRRLPELFAGHPAGPGGPAPYPVACSPQAWAAAVPFLLVESLLNLEVDAAARQVRLDPFLPEWLPWLTLRGLPAGPGRMDLKVEGRGRTVRVEASGLPPGWTVIRPDRGNP
ncbi:amylo-alpha-1,6-glucosidase [Limnochorda pilosa]|uniref:Amylo-alpha-1,6-glucosidase n=1 Tax=Limnochorda pilosa TaxID=1555112 RepID=A0A0K2SFY3_LIMPI|nr:glycogen debranching N-terminal domain-containing protein [Limnochorda pilosa]BAS26000.1 amylo-alpha-1,6-glucosidase [Limnochorda pilosa]